MPLTFSKRAFEGLPLIIFHGCEICIIKVASDVLDISVEEGTFTMELIIEPISLICYWSLRIEKGAISIHVIVFPFPIINTASLVIEFSIAISLFILNKPFIFGAILIFFNSKASIFNFWILILSFSNCLLRYWQNNLGNRL